jgi:peptidoglycan/xylan/chitin deacetylase (PgdA/CDA1 family)
MLRNKIKKIMAGLLYFSGINFIYNKIFVNRLVLIGGHSVIKYKNENNPNDETYKELSIDDKFLEEQIKYLLKSNYKFLNFRMVDELLGRGEKIPPKSVIMYFDDGFNDIYLNAYPIFKGYNLPFVIFVTTDLVDQKELPTTVKGKLGELSRTKNKIFLDWNEIRSMLDLAEIGSHGKTHRDFVDLNNEELKEEIIYSTNRIEEGAGKGPISLSFPHGKYNSKVQELIKQIGFKFAVVTKRGKANINDRFALKKIIIYPKENMTIFKLKLGIFSR